MPKDSCILIRKINDWCEEFDSGVGTCVGIGNQLSYCREELKETQKGFDDYNIGFTDSMEEIVDGFADLAFVALNGLYKTYRANGDSPELAKDNVFRSLSLVYNANNNKRDKEGNIIRNEVGKVVKPEGWTAPDHKPVLMYKELNSEK